MSDIRQMTAAEAAEALSADPRAVLIDVRTHAEWTYVGVPDVEGVLTISWQHYPTGAVDPDFVRRVRDAGVDPDRPVFLICRSGARSNRAAEALAAAGFTDLTNVSDGFEGDADAHCQRGHLNGWRHAGLPWRQS